MSLLIDVLVQDGFQPYFLTISPSRKTPFDDENVEHLVRWHKRLANQTLLVKELRDDGTPHFHSALTTKSKSAGNVTRSLERMFDKNSIEFTKGITIKIKSVPEMVGLYHYLLKDVTPDNPIVLLFGWRISWIRKQCLENLGKMPHKMLASEQHHLSTRTATASVIRYAKLRSLPISGKQCFKEVIYEMMKNHYDFSSVRMPQLYAQVSALTQNRAGVMSWLDNQLFNLD